MKILRALCLLLWIIVPALAHAATAGCEQYKDCDSLMSSDLDKEIVNCQDLDHNEGCYTVCGDGSATDDLNARVIKPATGRMVCVGNDYYLCELNGSSVGKRFTFSAAEYKKMRSLSKSIQDKGKCDYDENDIDMYIGSFIHDTDALIIENAIRLDDWARIIM